MATATVSQTEIIDAPRKKVYDFLVKPHKIPLILPGLIENTNIPDLPLKEGDRFNYKYEMYGVVLEGEWIVTELDEPNTYRARTTGDTESTWEYNLSEDDGTTTVHLHIDYEIPESVLERVQTSAMKRMNTKEADTLLHNLKTICEMKG